MAKLGHNINDEVHDFFQRHNADKRHHEDNDIDDKNSEQTSTSDDSFTDETYDLLGIPTPPEPPMSRLQLSHIRRLKHHKRVVRLSIVIVVLLIFSAASWFVLAPLVISHQNQSTQKTEIKDFPGPGIDSVDFTVNKGDSSDVIGKGLAQKGIVASSDGFLTAVANANAGSKLQPGTFSLKYRMKSSDVVKILCDSTQAKGLLQVTSNQRVSEIIANAAQVTGIAQSDFQDIINAKGVGILPAEANGSFEGWLEPGAYDVKSFKSAHDVLSKLVSDRIQKLDSLSVPQGSDREKIITIASIIEGEVNKQEYFGKVSRVIYNRLGKNMPLGMDSVVAYGNNVQPHQLTAAMINDASNPYNSRIHTGLPPTPINNPNDLVLQAAMNPDNGDWLYFVTVNLDTGETKFTDSEDEFKQFSQQYQDWEKNNDSSNN